jgi:hypothetical protein
MHFLQLHPSLCRLRSSQRTRAWRLALFAPYLAQSHGKNVTRAIFDAYSRQSGWARALSRLAKSRVPSRLWSRAQSCNVNELHFHPRSMAASKRRVRWTRGSLRSESGVDAWTGVYLESEVVDRGADTAEGPGWWHLVV